MAKKSVISSRASACPPRRKKALFWIGSTICLIRTILKIINSIRRRRKNLTIKKRKYINPDIIIMNENNNLDPMEEELPFDERFKQIVDKWCSNK